MTIHKPTWCVTLIALGIFLMLNRPQYEFGRGMVEKMCGWPLVHKRVYPGFSNFQLTIMPGYPQGIGVPTPIVTELDRPARLVNVLIAILLSATAGMTCQRFLHLFKSEMPEECVASLGT